MFDFLINSKIGFISLEQIESFDESEDKNLDIYFFNLELKETITELELFKKELLLISEKKILKVCIPECPQKLQIKNNVDLENDQNFTIKTCIKSKIHHSIYILFNHENDKSKSMILRCDLSTMKISKTQIDKEFSGFQVDNKDPSILYCILKKNMYKVSMENQSNLKEKNTTPERKTINQSKRKSKKSLVLQKRNKIDKENSKKIYHFYEDKKYDILSITFDKNKTLFFICNDKEIKKYDMETKKLLHTFKGHENEIRQLIFADDFSLMIR